jgi:hypothetical protein
LLVREGDADGVAFDHAVTGGGRLCDDGSDGGGRLRSGRGEGDRGKGWASRCGGCRRACGSCCCGWGGQIEVFGTDDVQAGGGGACCSAGESEPGERRHDEGLRRFGFFGFAEQEADARAVDAGCVGQGRLCDDDAGFSGGSNVRDCTEFEAEAADVDGGGAFALAEKVRDGDLLCAEAFGDAHGPLAADGRSGCGGLGQNAAGGRVGGIETVFESEAETEGAGLFAGVGEAEAGEVRDFDLAAVDGKAHGDEGGEKRDDEHRERAEDDVEEAVDAGDLHRSVRIYGVSQPVVMIEMCVFT